MENTKITIKNNTILVKYREIMSNIESGRYMITKEDYGFVSIYLSREYAKQPAVQLGEYKYEGRGKPPRYIIQLGDIINYSEAKWYFTVLINNTGIKYFDWTALGSTQ